VASDFEILSLPFETKTNKQQTNNKQTTNKQQTTMKKAKQQTISNKQQNKQERTNDFEEIFIFSFFSSLLFLLNQIRANLYCAFDY